MNFSAEYAEALSPADRNIYIMYHDKELEEERKQQKGESGLAQGPTIGSPIGV